MVAIGAKRRHVDGLLDDAVEQHVAEAKRLVARLWIADIHRVDDVDGGAQLSSIDQSFDVRMQNVL